MTSRLHNALVPEDPYAFPKYRVAFLNGLPVQNDTAQQWLKDGLRGGELEFLDQPWEENASWGSPAVKSIDGGNGEQPAASAEVSLVRPLTHLAMLIVVRLDSQILQASGSN